ncbi:Slc12a5 [Symbiodinium sp. CCMP2592]|nr:Slc12a5 [Symbiodinium sp. CCMP2592]
MREEVIELNQNWAGSPGRLQLGLYKAEHIDMGPAGRWSPHPSSEPLFAWAQRCGASENASGWAYDADRHQVTWRGSCLSWEDGASLRQCQGSPTQRWLLRDGRLWQLQPKAFHEILETPPFPNLEEGVLRLSHCNASVPSQRWKRSGRCERQCNVQNDLRFREGGCWEITGCSTAQAAEVGVNFGCKALPKTGAGGCEANGAWRFQGSQIRAVMDGKCLQVDLRDGRSVNVGSCTGQPHQQWEVDGALIRSLQQPSECIDSGIPAPPPETTGRCLSVQVLSLAAGYTEVGPALGLSDGELCDVSQPPAHPVRFADEHMFAGDLCVRALHGLPTAFGPLQLWAKPQPEGAAVLLLNRGSAAMLSAQVELSELGLEPARNYRVRDLWARRDLRPVSGSITMEAASGDSQLLHLAPLASGEEMLI